MVFDFRLPDAPAVRGDAGRWPATAGCSRSTARTRSCSTPPSPTRCSVVTCYRATTLTTRPPFVEAVATARALAFARQADAPVHVVHLSLGGGARRGPSREGGRGPRLGRDVPALPRPSPTRATTSPIRSAARAYVISPPLRSAADRDALWAGLADGSLDLVATDHVPDRMAVEKGDAARGVPFNEISNGAPGIETLLAVAVRGGRRQRPHHRRADGRPDRHDPGAPVRAGGQGRPRGRPGRRHRPLRPGRAPDDPRRRPPPHERLHAVRGARGRRGRPVASSSAAPPSSATARSSVSAGSGGSSSEGRSKPRDGRPSSTRSRPSRIQPQPLSATPIREIGAKIVGFAGDVSSSRSIPMIASAEPIRQRERAHQRERARSGDRVKSERHEPEGGHA